MRRARIGRRGGAIVVVALVAAAVGGVSSGPASGSGSQFTLFDQNGMRHTPSSYIEPSSTGGPTDWTSPTDYRDGKAYLRFEVTAKPSNMPLTAQLCLWRNTFTEETCSSSHPFSTTGVHWISLGSPGSWWKKGGTWDFTTPFAPARLMIKDPSRNQLLMTSRCGAACYTGPEDLADHTPIVVNASIIIVSKSGTLQPPPSWAGCPAAWSPSCTSGPTTTTASTTTAPASTTLPPPPPPSGRVVKLVVGSVPPVVADQRYVTWLTELGYDVRLVDDNGITAASLAGADLVVISSTIAPWRVGTWIARVDAPILSNEALLAKKLGLGTGGTQLSGQTAVDVVDGASPLSAGFTGLTAVTRSVAIGGVRGWGPAVDVVATAATQPTVATIVSVDADAPLPPGLAPDRRVGFFLAAPTPPKLQANGRALFDAAVAWLTESPGGTDPWWDAGWRYRVPVSAPGVGVERTGAVLEAPLDLTARMQADGASLSTDSLRVVEVDAGGSVIDAAVPFQFDPAPGFHPATAARGQLTIVPRGTSDAAGSRRFHLYFDVLGSGHSAASVTPRVKVSEGIVDEGQQSFRVVIDGSTWLYQKQGGGFSSLLDADGTDWLNYSTAAGSAGEFRGMPNAVFPQGHFHPGKTTSATTLVSSGPLKAVVESKVGTEWTARWEFFPTFARMTMVTAADDYWFLFEGTPGGSIDANDSVRRSTGVVSPIGTAWTGDLPGDEWVAFSDSGAGRSLYVAHVGGDSAVDSYRLMNGEMTVFGFGRSGVEDSLTGQRSFVVGFVESVGASAVSSAGTAAARAVSTAVGGVEGRPTGTP